MADHHRHQVEEKKEVSLMDKIHGNDLTPSDSEDEKMTSLKGKVHPLFGRDKPVHKVLGGGKEKTQMVKQRSSSTCRRGDKRNGRGQKNKCDSFSLKNGLVGFNSAAGGANFFGIYGLKPDAFDITKYVEELSLDELLRGSYNCPSIAKDKGKKAANSNINLLQSVRKACSLLQDPKVLQAQKIVDIDHDCVDRVSTALVTTSSAAGQIDDDRGDHCTSYVPSSNKVQESGDKMKTPPATDSPLYQPKDLLERLALPPPKDLDLLLSDAGKTTSKNCSDLRSGKPVSNRTGLPPFPWSNSLSGHTKMGADAIKLSASRTVCSGRWVKINNSTTSQKVSADLLEDFESLTFNQSLVPSVSVMSEHPEKKFAPSERAVSTSGECSTSKVLTDDHSPTHAAAQTLLDLANETSSAMVKMLKKPSQVSMKACKFKAVERSDKLFDAPKSLIRPSKHVRFGDDGFPPKKPKLSKGSTNSPPFPKRYRDTSYIELATACRLLGPRVPRWGNL